MYVGDGVCDDLTNIAECNYDGGDCCLFPRNTTYCSICQCFYIFEVGDGICNDEVNNAEHDYDGGDCCGQCVVTEYCTDCICHHQSGT